MVYCLVPSEHSRTPCANFKPCLLQVTKETTHAHISFARFPLDEIFSCEKDKAIHEKKKRKYSSSLSTKFMAFKFQAKSKPFNIATNKSEILFHCTFPKKQKF